MDDVGRRAKNERRKLWRRGNCRVPLSEKERGSRDGRVLFLTTIQAQNGLGNEENRRKHGLRWWGTRWFMMISYDVERSTKSYSGKEPWVLVSISICPSRFTSPSQQISLRRQVLPSLSSHRSSRRLARFRHICPTRVSKSNLCICVLVVLGLLPRKMTTR